MHCCLIVKFGFCLNCIIDTMSEVVVFVVVWFLFFISTTVLLPRRDVQVLVPSLFRYGCKFKLNLSFATPLLLHYSDSSLSYTHFPLSKWKLRYHIYFSHAFIIPLDLPPGHPFRQVHVQHRSVSCSTAYDEKCFAIASVIFLCEYSLSISFCTAMYRGAPAPHPACRLLGTVELWGRLRRYTLTTHTVPSDYLAL